VIFSRLWSSIRARSSDSSAPVVEEENPCKERDLFFASITHEMRTPLNGISGFAQILHESPLSDEQRELVETIQSSSAHLLELINSILDFSKIQSGRLTIEKTPFNLFRQIEDAVDTHALSASQKDVELGLYIDPEITPVLVGDRVKISQIIINLLSNAIKFTNSYGRVNLIVEKLEEDAQSVRLKFAVRDTGIGIDPQEQKTIFDPFLQATSTERKKSSGTGLGLAITSKLVEMMGGRLELESKPGEGSCFCFTLTMEKSRTKESALYAKQFLGLRTGLLMPNRAVDREIDRYLERYLRYLGTDFEILYHDEVLEQDQPPALPDILFVDQRYARQENELDRILALDTKIVLMTTATIKREYAVNAAIVDRIIHKPINLSKIARALKACTQRVQSVAVREIDIERSLKGLRVLVAEDNLINQKLMRHILENMEIEVTIADNGKKALDYFRQEQYDMVFMDIQMPIMDGIETSKAIVAYEEDRHLRHVPIIALTASSRPEDTEHYLNAGMDAHLTKPIDIEEIKAVMARYAPVTLDSEAEKEAERQMHRELFSALGEEAVAAEHLPNPSTAAPEEVSDTATADREDIPHEPVQPEPDTLSIEPSESTEERHEAPEINQDDTAAAEESRAAESLPEESRVQEPVTEEALPTQDTEEPGSIEFQAPEHSVPEQDEAVSPTADTPATVQQQPEEGSQQPAKRETVQEQSDTNAQPFEIKYIEIPLSR